LFSITQIGMGYNTPVFAGCHEKSQLLALLMPVPGNRRQTELVSCIMATKNRRRFIPQALRCFLRQSYQNSELVIVDDGEDSVADLCCGIPRVRYVRITCPLYTGTKLNIGIEVARGDILQKLDDDDYYSPDFLNLAVSRLLAGTGKRLLVAWDCFLVLFSGDPRLRHSGHGWQVGGTLCFQRKLWEQTPFRDLPKSIDHCFVVDHQPTFLPVCAAEHYLVVRHGRNTWNKMRGGETADSYLGRRTLYSSPLEAVVHPEDLPFYKSLTRQS
jgi:glycosyltransferase involved in cell wall biosynthesis